MAVRIGIVGAGKIAADRHVPALRNDPAFALIACADPLRRIDGVASYASLEAMLEGAPNLDAIAVCTPPQTHFALARLALLRGKHVLLEKPPCSTLAELDELTRIARGGSRTLFQAWHARHAAAVNDAAAWLKPRRICHAAIVWKEDVRVWHLGQSWIWQANGFGVFDPGINALSILTKIVVQDIALRSAELLVPANREAPIAAHLQFETQDGAAIVADFDFRQSGEQIWDIDIETGGGTLKLSHGGSVMAVDGKPIAVPPQQEYPDLYRRFAQLIARGEFDVDARPFQLAIEALTRGKRVAVEAFDD